jgi:hypothetical protein
MKASELRIGNYFKHSLFEDYLEIQSISESGLCSAKEVNGGFEIEHTNPIPLTEEWLLKFGFKQCGYEMLSWKHETLLPSFDLGGINWADFDEPDYQFLTYKVGDEILRIDYVHQLQNLYFALTGEELKQQEQ